MNASRYKDKKDGNKKLLKKVKIKYQFIENATIKDKQLKIHIVKDVSTYCGSWVGQCTSTATSRIIMNPDRYFTKIALQHEIGHMFGLCDQNGGMSDAVEKYCDPNYMTAIQASDSLMYSIIDAEKLSYDDLEGQIRIFERFSGDNYGDADKRRMEESLDPSVKLSKDITRIYNKENGDVTYRVYEPIQCIEEKPDANSDQALILQARQYYNVPAAGKSQTLCKGSPHKVTYRNGQMIKYIYYRYLDTKCESSDCLGAFYYAGLACNYSDKKYPDSFIFLSHEWPYPYQDPDDHIAVGFDPLKFRLMTQSDPKIGQSVDYQPGAPWFSVATYARCGRDEDVPIQEIISGMKEFPTKIEKF
ncbi:MAG: hypothetical protein V1647_00710 [Pseudomonadota bacterium]